MMKYIIVIILAFTLLIASVSCIPAKQDQTPLSSPCVTDTAATTVEPDMTDNSPQPPTAEPEPIETEVPKVAEIDPYTVNMELVSLPEGFSTVQYPLDTVSYGDRVFFISVGEESIELTLEGPEIGARLFTGLCRDKFAAKTDEGFYLCSNANHSISGNAETDLLPKDRLFFFDANTMEIRDVGMAMHGCIMIGNRIYGIRQELDEDKDDASGTIIICRYDIDDHQQQEIYRMQCQYAGGRFYAVNFDDKHIVFTMLINGGVESCDCGIYCLDIEKIECVRIADHGLPYAVSSDGKTLMYGDYPG